MPREQITVDELKRRLQAQGTSGRDHAAFKCPVCATVQSMASLKRACCPADQVEACIAFSCEGRFSGAGSWPADDDQSAKAQARRQRRGCDWTLGGLLHLHELEVMLPDGNVRMAFAIASPEEAQALERQMTAAAAAD